jgi:hypothetical protein
MNEIFTHLECLEERELSDNEITKKEIKKFLKSLAIEKIKCQRFLKFFTKGFTTIEHPSNDMRVSDIIMNSQSFMMLRKYAKELFDMTNKTSELHRGLFGYIYGARIWVQAAANNEIFYFQENSIELPKLFPYIAESIKILKFYKQEKV